MIEIRPLAAAELELVGLGARDLGGDLLAAAERQLDADLEAEVQHAADHRLLGAVDRRVPVPGRVPVVRAVAEVREPERAAQQERGGRAADPRGRYLICSLR